jgi:hypothetical protein
MAGKTRLRLAVIACFGVSAFAVAHAQSPADVTTPAVNTEPPVVGGETFEQVSSESATGLAKKLQNPIGNLNDRRLGDAQQHGEEREEPDDGERNCDYETGRSHWAITQSRDRPELWAPQIAIYPNILPARDQQA